MVEPGHFIKLCKKCNVVSSTCRCMDKNKPIIYSVCEECKEKEIAKCLNQPS
jgi:hypothetical protein